MTDPTKPPNTKTHKAEDVPMTSPLQRPVALELVSAETVDFLLEATEFEQTELRRRADDLLDTACQLDHELAALGITPEASTHLMMCLHEFLAELAAEAAAEGAAVVSTAHRRVALTHSSHNWMSTLAALAASGPVVVPDPRRRSWSRRRQW